MTRFDPPPTELTRIMGHKNPDQFFNDATAINPQTGQLLHPPPAPPSPPPDPKLVAAQARAQLDQQQAQNDAIHQQVKAQAEIELARIKAGLDARIALLDAHLKAVSDAQKMSHAHEQHRMDVTEAALGMAAAAAHHETKMQQTNKAEETDV